MIKQNNYAIHTNTQSMNNSNKRKKATAYISMELKL